MLHKTLISLTISALLLPHLLVSLTAAEPFPIFYPSPSHFRAAATIAEREVQPIDARITGVTVPHHLLAADMIASTLRLASKGKYDRILLLTPDHFRRSTAPAATTLRPFQTVWGDVPIDADAARTLITTQTAAESNLFSHEHGVQAILPFLAKWFPEVPVLPIALDIRSRPDEWARITDALIPLVTPRTLIIQSTDFSHYLSQPVAAEKDQQTLHTLCLGKPDAIPALIQPDHLDSKAAQWIHMTLQAKVHGITTPVIVDNRNAIRYGGRADEPSTTSYITQLYSPDFIPAKNLPGESYFIGGDTHFGRYIARAFEDPKRSESIRSSILNVTGGRPLIINLEGVILDDPIPDASHPMQIGMTSTLALPELKKLGVTAVSLANNHTLDFGLTAREHMIQLLRKNHITPLTDGPPVDFGRFRIGVATDLANHPQPAHHLLTKNSFSPWKADPSDKPLVAFLHAGVEYTNTPGKRERQLAQWAESAGATLVLGGHPHRPSPAWERSANALHFHSLGNLIFDQTDPKNTGGLIELRFFEQNTWSARWIPLGNLYANKPE